MLHRKLSLTLFTAFALLGCGDDDSTPFDGGGDPVDAGPADAGPGLDAQPAEDGGCVESNGGAEACDGADNDCDGIVDEDATDATTFYVDADEDGFGEEGTSDTIDACEAPDGYAAVDTDCDDTEPTVYPDAPGLCDDLDNDCNGEVDDVRLVSDASVELVPSSGSGSTSAVLDREDPPEVLATPTDTGFCTVQWDQGESQWTLSHFDASSDTSVSVQRSGASTQTHHLLDIAWDGTYCAVLVDSSGTGVRQLRVMRWDLSLAGSATLVPLLGSASLPAIDSGVRHAAMDSVCIGGACTTPEWVVVYQTIESGAVRVQTIHFDQAFEGPAISAIEERVVDGNAGTSVSDIEIGPAPPLAGVAAIVFDEQDTENAMRIATIRNTLDRSVDVRPGWDDDSAPESYSLPVLAEVDGSPVLIRYNESEAQWELRELEYSAGSAGASYGLATYQIEASGERSYVSKDVVATGPARDYWLAVTNDADDFIRGADLAFGTGAREPIVFGFADVASVDVQVLTLRDGGDRGVEVLRLTDGEPFTLTVDRYTCH